MSEAAEEQGEHLPCSMEAEKHDEISAARRLRAIARKERAEDSAEEEEKTKSQQQVELSERKRISLLSDGKRLITNIQVAADAKESQRRTDLRESHRLQVEKLESEARSSMQKFEEITRGWSLAKAHVIPQDLQEALFSQQQLCSEVLEDKNKLINDLQQELKARNDRYAKELKRQGEEVDLIIERMEEQGKSLMRTNREELEHIEKAYEDERRVLLSGQTWEQHLKERSTKELEHMIQRRRKVEEYEAMLETLRLEEIEDYNLAKEKLETDFQTRQQRTQQHKATAQLNQDKQEFNIHVLTHRETDNKIIQSKLKRKITRLQDVLTGLKAKSVQQTKQAAEETLSQCDHYARAVQQHRDMQKKIKHFAAVDDKRFAAMWQMKEAEVRELAERVLDIDRLLHEQQLGLAWERPPMPPKPPPPSRQGPATADAAVGPSPPSGPLGAQSAMACSEARSDQASSTGEGAAAGRGDGGKVSAKTVKRLLQLLCDEAGFLIERKLLTLLTPLDKDNQSLIKLDSILCSLGVQSKDDLYMLAEFFSDYQRRQTQQADAEEPRASSTASMTSDLFHPNEVLAALKAFTAQYRQPRGQSAPQHPSSTITGGPDGPDEAVFWEGLANVLPESKLKTWTALDSALEKYHAVLTERSQRFMEIQALKQQNAELRLLLPQSLNSKVNSELEIPPTQLMKMAPK